MKIKIKLNLIQNINFALILEVPCITTDTRTSVQPALSKILPLKSQIIISFA